MFRNFIGNLIIVLIGAGIVVAIGAYISSLSQAELELASSIAGSIIGNTAFPFLVILIPAVLIFFVKKRKGEN